MICDLDPERIADNLNSNIPNESDEVPISKSVMPTLTNAMGISPWSVIFPDALGGPRDFDYAIVELDRVVIGRTPLETGRIGVAPVGTDLVIAGHPSGKNMH